MGEGIIIVERFKGGGRKFPKAQMLCPERGVVTNAVFLWRQRSEQGVAHRKATAAQNLMHSSFLGEKKKKKKTHHPLVCI